MKEGEFTLFSNGGDTLRIHVLPLNDIKDHNESKFCKCEPRVEEDGKLIIHNAYDGREFFEDAIKC